MANVTIALTDAFLPEYWATSVLENFDKNAVLPPLVDRQWEKLLKPGGDRVNVPDIDNVTARTLASMTGATTFDSATEGVTTIIVNTAIYHAKKIDDAAVAQNVLPLFEAYSKEMGIALALKIDTDLYTEMSTTSNTRGSDNIAVTSDVVELALEDLDGADNPDDNRYSVWHPKSFWDLMKVEKYISKDYDVAGFTGAKRGYTGRTLYGNVPVYMSTNAKAGAAGHENFIWHRTGIALILQEDIKFQRRFPHDEFAEVIRCLAMYGVKLMRAASVIEVDGR